MGNFLEQCREGIEESDGVSNKGSKSSPLDDSMYVTPHEREAIRSLYRVATTICGGNGGDSKALDFSIGSGRADGDHRRSAKSIRIFTHETVQNVFEAAPILAKLLEKWLPVNVPTSNEFEDFIINLTRITASNTIEILWRVISFDSTIEKSYRLETLYSILLELSLTAVLVKSSSSSHESNFPNSETIQSVARKLADFYTVTQLRFQSSTNSGDGDCTGREIFSGLNFYSPFAAKILESYFSLLCFAEHLSPAYKPFLPPKLSIPSEICTAVELMPLAMYCSALQGRWHRLYSTSIDGLSFNRVVHHTMGYDGPTCILIRCRDDRSIIGALAMERWRESNTFHGSTQNMLFSLAPKLRMYRCKGGRPCNEAATRCQWLNTKSFSMPHGMGFGGTTDGFRLFIPESLEHCSALATCPTYETGKLLPQGSMFEIDVMEVWGCGGSDEAVLSALMRQQEEREAADETLRKARKVDKAAFFNNEFDREMFLSQTTSYTKEIASRGTQS